MSMLCSLLRVDPQLLERLKHDEDLTAGVTSLAHKRHLDAQFELMLQGRPVAEQESARARRTQREAEALTRVPQRFADQIKRQLELRERASKLDIGPALSLEKSWDAFEHLFALAGGSLFRGQPIGPNQGYGPALCLLPSEVHAFSAFLDKDGRAQVAQASVKWLKAQRLYGWPDVGDAIDSDEILLEGLRGAFEDLNSYVAVAASESDAILIWVH